VLPLCAADDINMVPVLSADLGSAAAAFEAANRCQSRPSSQQAKTFDTIELPELLYALHRIALNISLTAGFSFTWRQEADLQAAAPAPDAAAAAAARKAALAADAAEDRVHMMPSGVNERASAVAAKAATAAVKLAKAGARPAQVAAAAGEVYGLLVSCCKAAAQIFEEYPTMRESYGMEVATAANTTRAAAKAVYSKLCEADAAADAAPWVALVARCMRLSGAAVAAAVAAPESAQVRYCEGLLCCALLGLDCQLSVYLEMQQTFHYCHHHVHLLVDISLSVVLYMTINTHTAVSVFLLLCISRYRMLRTSLQRGVTKQRPEVTNAPSSMLQAELDDVEWLMQHLQTLSSSSRSSSSAAGPTTADLQHLQELQEELELGLWKSVKALKTWSDKLIETAADLLQEVRREVKPVAAQQLEAFEFGAAAASQVPVKVCCNRPGCWNMQQLSEAVLVGGKGNICSGCKVARYCGKECQVGAASLSSALCSGSYPFV
jgi:hypothetical protein